MTAPPAADFAAVEAVVRASATSFHRGMMVLPAERRNAMYAVYAFCRMVDDIADEPSPIESRRPRLEAWRRRVAGLYRGEADDAVTRVLVWAVRKFALRQADFEAVIDGMEMDAVTTIVAPSLAELDLYCDRVAAAVGRLSVRAFGEATAAADEVAWHLGRALQLTNILRDVAEDAGRGRLYLPRELLDMAGVPADAGAALHHPGLATASAALAAIARQHFSAAASAMVRCDRRAMKPARLMGATYQAVLTALERRGWDRPEVPVSLPKWRKAWIGLRFGLL